MQRRVEGASAEIESLLAVGELQHELSQAVSAGHARPAQVESIRQRLAQLLASVPAGLMARSETLLREAHPPAIQVKSASHCPACHIRFPAQLEFKVRNRSVAFACPRCNRLLYHLEPPAERKTPRRGRRRNAPPVRRAGRA